MRTIHKPTRNKETKENGPHRTKKRKKDKHRKRERRKETEERNNRQKQKGKKRRIQNIKEARKTTQRKQKSVERESYSYTEGSSGHTSVQKTRSEQPPKPTTNKKQTHSEQRQIK